MPPVCMRRENPTLIYPPDLCWVKPSSMGPSLRSKTARPRTGDWEIRLGNFQPSSHSRCRWNRQIGSHRLNAAHDAQLPQITPDITSPLLLPVSTPTLRSVVEVSWSYPAPNPRLTQTHACQRHVTLKAIVLLATDGCGVVVTITAFPTTPVPRLTTKRNSGVDSRLRIGCSYAHRVYAL